MTLRKRDRVSRNEQQETLLNYLAIDKNRLVAVLLRVLRALTMLLKYLAASGGNQPVAAEMAF